MARKRKTASKRKTSLAGRAANGRFKRMKGKNTVAARAGRKGHQRSCRRYG